MAVRYEDIARGELRGPRDAFAAARQRSLARRRRAVARRRAGVGALLVGIVVAFNLIGGGSSVASKPGAPAAVVLALG